MAWYNIVITKIFFLLCGDIYMNDGVFLSYQKHYLPKSVKKQKLRAMELQCSITWVDLRTMDFLLRVLGIKPEEWVIFTITVLKGAH